MSCHEQGRLIDAYVDGELEVAAALALEEHVRACARCRAELTRRRAVRAALQRHAGIEAAPAALRARLHARFAPRRAPPLTWRWGLLLAAPGIAALALAAWLGLSLPDTRHDPGNAPVARVVYHIPSSDTARSKLRNLANHLNAAPDVKIVVVAHNDGVDFLLRGARDELGPFEPEVNRFRELGVEFRVCDNTLKRRQLDVGQVIGAAVLVPSGIAEIGRLQSEEGYVYMRL